MEKTGERTESGLTLHPDWADVAIFNMGTAGFSEYKQRVFKALDKLQPNHYYDIISSVPVYRREICLGICSTYIDSHPDYELTEDNCRIYNRKRRLITVDGLLKRKNISGRMPEKQLWRRWPNMSAGPNWRFSYSCIDAR